MATRKWAPGMTLALLVGLGVGCSSGGSSGGGDPAGGTEGEFCRMDRDCAAANGETCVAQRCFVCEDPVVAYDGSSCYPTTAGVPAGAEDDVGRPCAFDSCRKEAQEAGPEVVAQTCPEGLFCDRLDAGSFIGACSYRCDESLECTAYVDAIGREMCSDPSVTCETLDQRGDHNLCITTADRQIVIYSSCTTGYLFPCYENEGSASYSDYVPGSFPGSDHRDAAGGVQPRYHPQYCVAWRTDSIEDPVNVNARCTVQPPPGIEPGCPSHAPCCNTCPDDCSYCDYTRDIECFSDCMATCWRCCEPCSF